MNYQKLLRAFVPALQVQLAPAIGYFFCLLVSLFYLFLNDSSYVQEKPQLMFFGFGVSMILFALGMFLNKNFLEGQKIPKSLRRGALITILAWIFGCTVSALVFVLAGFPDPSRVGDFSFFRMFVDGWYESMSGFTTTGASILPSVEVFPRSLLLWRSTMHLIGGMGIAYLGITIIKAISTPREDIINGEAETHTILEYRNEEEARESGFDFLKIYLLITGILIGLLVISGASFRQTPYENWHDNVYDSVYYGISTMGTGGFAPYDASAGLKIKENGQEIIGGLRNPASEWIIAFFMFVAGANFAIWYDLLIKRRLGYLLKNKELRLYTGIAAGLTLLIGTGLYFLRDSRNLEESFRYAFFNVTNIISTTGLGNADFTLWPAIAQGFLFIAYLTGGMVGSTSGGLKAVRFLAGFEYIKMELRNLLTGSNKKEFVLDEVKYNRQAAGLILSTMILYFFTFFTGLILIMATSPKVTMMDGTTSNIDFTSAVTASIANLGNIGPAVAVGSVNAGPSGNYSVYSEWAKIVMILLMFIGRVGILSLVVLFITPKGQENIDMEIPEEMFDSDLPLLIR
jgi:trk system potassium uptake protein TrkH